MKPDKQTKTDASAQSSMTRLRSLVAISAISCLLLSSGCVYYNTFYNAKKNFNDAEKTRLESAKRGGRPTVNKSKYKIAIEKASIILEKHPDSKYYDDALYVIGVSYFWTEDYLRSQRKFRELLANFEESDFVTRSKLYLAKCKLELDERAEAVTIFQNLLETVDDDAIKAEASFAIGDFYYEQEEYSSAEVYYQALIDSLASNDSEKRRATMLIADGRFAKFDIATARELYKRTLDMKPDEKQEYHARYSIGACDFFLQNIVEGIETYQTLADDERYFDSIGSIRLQIARGYEMDDDLILAAEEYEAITLEAETSPASGAALHNLAMIYQYDYEDLEKALDYYELAKKKGRGRNPYYEESFKRAADITKLEEFRVSLEFDSSSTQDHYDKASLAQLRLGELYLLDLDQPDSAISAFEYAIDSFPEGYYTPRALVSLALTHRDFLDDTLTFDSIAQLALSRYPKSDFYGDALAALDLTGSPADTGHPASYFSKAENWLSESASVESDLDSALFYYQWVVDSFPNSTLNPQAQFALIWLEDQYRNVGDDSTIIFAYAELAEAHPDHEFGKQASSIASGSVAKQAATDRTLDDKLQNDELASADENGLDGEDYEGQQDGDSTVVAAAAAQKQIGPFTEDEMSLNPELRFYVRNDTQQLWDAPNNPGRVREIDFIYPEVARNQPDIFDLFFHVKLDIDGIVLEFELMNPTEYRELNEAVSEQVDNLQFDMGRLGDLGYGDGWFVYKRRMTRPEYLRP